MISVWFAHERAIGGCPGETEQMRRLARTSAAPFDDNLPFNMRVGEQ